MHVRNRTALTFPLQTVQPLHVLLRYSLGVTSNRKGIFLVDEVRAVFSQKVYVWQAKRWQTVRTLYDIDCPKTFFWLISCQYWLLYTLLFGWLLPFLWLCYSIILVVTIADVGLEWASSVCYCGMVDDRYGGCFMKHPSHSLFLLGWRVQILGNLFGSYWGSKGSDLQSAEVGCKTF